MDRYPDKREVEKQLIKEAIREWLDDIWLSWGKWSAAGIAAAMFGAIIYLILIANGWHK